MVFGFSHGPHKKLNFFYETSHFSTNKRLQFNIYFILEFFLLYFEILFQVSGMCLVLLVSAENSDHNSSIRSESRTSGKRGVGGGLTGVPGVL